MHFGFFITSAAALKWTLGEYTDAQLLLNDDDIGGIVTVRSKTDYYWIGSAKSLQECFECRAYGPRFCFRATVPTIGEWALRRGFRRGLIEIDTGAVRFIGTIAPSGFKK